jgi:dienelactone hydrolase
MPRLVSAAFVAALPCASSAFAEQPLSLNPSNVGALGSNKAGELVLPGATPLLYPAVIVLRGCNGVSRNVRECAIRLADWGYAGDGQFPAARRIPDVFAAANYLSNRKYIDPNHIGALGISHGAETVIYAAAAPTIVKENVRAPQAIVAY